MSFPFRAINKHAGKYARVTFSAGLRFVTLVWLILHFSLTALYLSPINPLKMLTQPFLMRTIGTYFPQNWSLFAPNPASDNFSLLVSFLTAEDYRRYVRLGAEQAVEEGSGWYDITTPLIRHFHRHRFSGYDRFSRPADAAVRSMISRPPELDPWAEACNSSDYLSCIVLGERLQIYRELSLERLRRIASSACEDLITACDQIRYVALRIRRESSIPWSRRYSQKQGEYQDINIGVVKRLNGVMRANLYTNGNN